MAAKKDFVPVVAVLNMKGGVGKTTISAHVFRVLFERKMAGTLLIDLDPQFNLTQALFTRDAYEIIKNEDRTILTVMEPPPEVGLFDVKTSSLPPPPVGDVTYGFLTFSTLTPPQDLDIVPGNFKLVKYCLMDDHNKLTSVRERFEKFIMSTKDYYKIICIDCNPSSSFLTLCALQACTHVLVPVRPDRYSILGLEILYDFIENVPTIFPKPEILVVLNGIQRGAPRTAPGSVEAELRGHSVFGAKTLAHVIHHSTLLQAKTNYTGFATDRKVAWRHKVRLEISALADELAEKIGV